jgi:hypothetical protein
MLGLLLIDNYWDVHAKVFTPGTFEITVPVGTTGLAIFGNLIFKRPDSSGRQEIEIALGASWDIQERVAGTLGRIPKIGAYARRAIDVLPELTAAIFVQGGGSQTCGCWDFCKLSINGAITAGEGRRGGVYSGNVRPLGGGISGEIQGELDICEGSLSLNYTVVGSINVNLGLGRLGSIGYNRDFEHEGELIGPGKEALWRTPSIFNQLKWARSCN